MEAKDTIIDTSYASHDDLVRDIDQLLYKQAVTTLKAVVKELCEGCNGCSTKPDSIEGLCSNPLEKYLYRKCPLGETESQAYFRGRKDGLMMREANIEQAHIAKPPLRSGEQLSEEIQQKTKKWSICNPRFIEDIANISIEVQRDADAAYYEPIIQGAQEEIDYIHIQQKAIEGKLDDVELAIQQAKEEVAREIDTFISQCECRGYDWGDIIGIELYHQVGQEEWQKFKSQYTESK